MIDAPNNAAPVQAVTPQDAVKPSKRQLAEYRHSRSASAASITFDYASLPTVVADEVRAAAGRVRRRMRDSIIETGRDLIMVRAKLEHGEFGKSLAAEFGLTERSAENYMNAARWAEDKSEIISVLPPTALYLLSAKSTPRTVGDDVLARVERGERVDVAAIRRLVAHRRSGEREGTSRTKGRQRHLKRPRLNGQSGVGKLAAMWRDLFDDLRHRLSLPEFADLLEYGIAKVRASTSEPRSAILSDAEQDWAETDLDQDVNEKRRPVVDAERQATGAARVKAEATLSMPQDAATANPEEQRRSKSLREGVSFPASPPLKAAPGRLSTVDAETDAILAESLASMAAIRAVRHGDAV